MNLWAEFKDYVIPSKAANASPEVIEALHSRTANFNIVRAVNAQVAYQAETAVNWGGQDIYDHSPAVRTVVDLLKNNIGQLDLRLFKETKPDQREEQPDHPAMESLRHPNPSMSSDQFIRCAIQAFCLYDNFYAYKLRGANGTTQFVVLPPERVKIRGPGLVPTSYVIWNLDGTETLPEPAQNILHWRGENFSDMRIGSSRLETLRAVIVEEAAMQQQMIELAKSGMAGPIWISRPNESPELSFEGLQRLEEHTANRLRDVNKVPPLMEEGMRLEGFGFSPKDAEALATRKFALQQVASLYNVPLGMVGLGDGLLGDVEKARAEFFSDTIPTICEAFCRQLNRSVLVDEYSEEDLFFQFGLDEKMAGDERIKTMTSAAGVPPLLRNEARARLNLPPVDGGDEPMTPANMNPGNPADLVPSPPGTPGSKPSDNVMPIQNPAGPDQGGGARQGDPGVTQASITEAIRKHIARVASKKWNRERSDRELTEDLIGAGLNGDAELLAGLVNDELERGLAGGAKAEVFERAKAEAPQLAARWQMRPEEMKELGLPSEVVWERMGFSKDEIDRMAAMRWADSLAENGSVAEDH